jgi:hypothetical protein
VLVVLKRRLQLLKKTLRSAGYESHLSVSSLRGRLTSDDEFAVALAVLYLKLELDSGMNERLAYLSYALDDRESRRLRDPNSSMVQNSTVLSARSARYDANMRALRGAGDLMEYFDINQLPTPTYGARGGTCGSSAQCSFRPALAPGPLSGVR